MIKTLLITLAKIIVKLAYAASLIFLGGYIATAMMAAQNPIWRLFH